MWLRRGRRCCSLASPYRTATVISVTETTACPNIGISSTWASQGMPFPTSKQQRGKRHYSHFKTYIDPEKTVDLGHHKIEVSSDPSTWNVPKDWTEVRYPEKIKQLAYQVMSLNAIEGVLLKRYIMKKQGLKDEHIFGQPQVMVAPQGTVAPGGAAPAAAPKVEEEERKPEKTEFKLVLTEVPADAKVKVLKEVRVLKPGMKLLESKDLVEKLPSVLKENVPKAEAEEWVAKFKEVGATLTLQ